MDEVVSLKTKFESHAKSKFEKQFGVEYFETGISRVINSNPADLYFYTVYLGPQQIKLALGDCCYYLGANQDVAYLERGPKHFVSKHIATVIRGYTPESRTCNISHSTNLPYINGCSTKQIFPPERLGDPTLQLLYMPPYSTEQAHHIHSTVRVVYVLAGRGKSVVGLQRKTISEELYPGKTVILQKMCPHHFETDTEALVVMPLHVFSSTGPQEFNHPMFNGTQEIS